MGGRRGRVAWGAPWPTPWWYWLTWVVWAVGFTACVGPALSGHQDWNVGGLGGFIGAAAGTWFRNADFWRLPAADRRRVLQAGRTGTPTGDRDLDALVRDRLQQAVRARTRGNDVTLAVVLVVAAAVPVVATIRTGDRWYLLGTAATVVVAAVIVAWRRRTGDPAVRLDRLEVALTAGP